MITPRHPAPNRTPPCDRSVGWSMAARDRALGDGALCAYPRAAAFTA